MRHPLVPALLLVLAVLGFAVGGALVVAATPAADGADPSTAADTPTRAPTETPGRTTSISGTVAYPNGSAAGGAYVMVGSFAGFVKRSPDELLSVARDDPQGVTVVRADAEGEFSVDADGRAVVAVSAFGVSRAHFLDEAPRTLTLSPTKPLSVGALGGGDVAPGGTTTMRFDVRNDGDRPVEDLRLAVDLPDGWTVVRTETGGEFDAGEVTFTWSSLGADEWAEAKLTVRVPDDADFGIREVRVRATSATHPVADATARADVTPAGTPRPNATKTATPPGRTDPDGTAAAPGETATGSPAQTGTESPEVTASPGDSPPASATPTTATDAPVPGFGAAVALVALVSTAALAVRRV